MHKQKLIHAYAERDKPFEEREDFKDLEELTKDRKRDKKRKEKKRKHHKRSRHSSSDSVKSNDDKSNVQNEFLMSSNQFVSTKDVITATKAPEDHEAGPAVPENFFEELKEKEEKEALEKKLKQDLIMGSYKRPRR